MTETEEPGFAERDDDEFSEQTGGGVEPGQFDQIDSDDDDSSPDEESVDEDL